MGRYEDLSRKVFGLLKVIKYDHSDKQGTYWVCECECKNKVIVRKSHLTSGHTRSCGCLNRKINANRKLTNKYNLSGIYGIGWTTNTNREFYFDIEDYNKIKSYCWLEHDGYIIASDGTLLHRLVMNADKNNITVIDHIHHATNDNRKSELRGASCKENSRNRVLQKNNMIGIRGIYKYPNGSYRASITKDGQTYTKTSKDLNFVVKWRREKEIELFKEFAYKEKEEV